MAEFDSEWAQVLDEAKRELSLTPIHDLLRKWRFVALGELQEPGSHERMMAKAEQIHRLGHNPDAASPEEMHALIARRLGR